MFVYVRPYVPDLRVREYEMYRAYYCGLCRSMKRTTGYASSFFLSYDMVFLLMARLLYSDTRPGTVKKRCPAHSLKKHTEAADHPEIRMTARLSAVLTAAKNRDDKNDEQGPKRLRSCLLSPFLRRGEKKAGLPHLSEKISHYLSELAEMEKNHMASLDRPADLSGEILRCVFAEGFPEGEARTVLGDLGFQLGRLIYKIDAYEDYPEDCRKNRYNPFRYLYGEDAMTPERAEDARLAIQSDFTALEEVFLRLPLREKDELSACLKNILYLGLCDKPSPPNKKGTPNDGSV